MYLELWTFLRSYKSSFDVVSPYTIHGFFQEKTSMLVILKTYNRLIYIMSFCKAWVSAPDIGRVVLRPWIRNYLFHICTCASLTLYKCTHWTFEQFTIIHIHTYTYATFRFVHNAHFINHREIDCVPCLYIKSHTWTRINDKHEKNLNKKFIGWNLLWLCIT